MLTPSMAFCSCLCHPPLPIKINGSIKAKHSDSVTKSPKLRLSLKDPKMELSRMHIMDPTRKLRCEWSSIGRSRAISIENHGRYNSRNKSSRAHASWLASGETPSNILSIGTAAVVPFYTLMVVAPKSEMTKKCMESVIPVVVLTGMYAYLVCLSWTPETMWLMFPKLPELRTIVEMFSNKTTLASAWLHLLAVDLFAARQVYLDGLANKIETRHSISICMVFCPIGILTHVITKMLTNFSRNSKTMTH